VKPPSANLFSAVLCYCRAPLLAGGLSAAFYARVYAKGLGGFTGDTSGAAIETGEELCLFFTVVFFAVLFKGGLS
jgi:cobalamin synthase